jgi:hypothetical protein
MSPSGPSVTAPTAAASVSIEKITSAASPTWRGLSASRIPSPRAARTSRRYGQPVASRPASSSRSTISPPIEPVPSQPILIRRLPSARGPCAPPPRSSPKARATAGVARECLAPLLVVGRSLRKASSGTRNCLGTDAMNAGPYPPFVDLWYTISGETLDPSVPGVVPEHRLTRQGAPRRDTQLGLGLPISREGRHARARQVCRSHRPPGRLLQSPAR